MQTFSERADLCSWTGSPDFLFFRVHVRWAYVSVCMYVCIYVCLHKIAHTFGFSVNHFYVFHIEYARTYEHECIPDVSALAQFQFFGIWTLEVPANLGDCHWRALACFSGFQSLCSWTKEGTVPTGSVFVVVNVCKLDFTHNLVE